MRSEDRKSNAQSSPNAKAPGAGSAKDEEAEERARIAATLGVGKIDDILRVCSAIRARIANRDKLK